MIITRKRFILIFVCFLILFSIIFLIGPRVADEKQEEECVVNIDLPSVFGFSMDCDSPEFLRLAMNPSGLLEYENTRQSRPGSVFASYIISYPFRPFTSIIELIKPGISREVPDRINKSFEYYIPAFLAYLFSNFVVIILSLFLVLSIWISDKKKINLIYIFSALFLFVNILFPKFFFSPHNQFFNVLVPIFCVWLAHSIWEKNLFGKRKIYLYSLLAGIGATFYATFFLCFPIIVITSFFKRNNLKDFIIKNLIILVLIIFPVVSWIIFVKFKTGNFYSHETSGCNQLIWIFDNGILETMVIYIKNLFLIWRDFFKEFYLFLLFLIVVIYLSGKDFFIKNKNIVIISLLISVLFSLFFALIGLIAVRTIYSMIPPLYVLLGLALVGAYEKMKTKYIIFVISFLFFMFNILFLFK